MLPMTADALGAKSTVAKTARVTSKALSRVMFPTLVALVFRRLVAGQLKEGIRSLTGLSGAADALEPAWGGAKRALRSSWGGRAHVAVTGPHSGQGRGGPAALVGSSAHVRCRTTCAPTPPKRGNIIHLLCLARERRGACSASHVTQRARRIMQHYATCWPERLASGGWGWRR
jgi:hypothetical protein